MGISPAGEHLLRKQGVNGLIPLSSTAEPKDKQSCLSLVFGKTNATLFNKTEEGCVTLN